MDITTFLKGTPKVPRLLQADAYTIGSIHISQEARDRSVYHVVPRKGLDKSPFNPTDPIYGPIFQDGRLIFVGLRRILRDLLTTPVTFEEIEETEKFLKSFHAGATQFYWDKSLWMRVVEHYNGIVPIRIEALKEGTVVFPGEPCMQITSCNGFNLGELAAYFESRLLHVWASMERVTALAWWRKYLRDKCASTHPSWPSDKVNFATSIMFHDFGDRAAICAQESEVLGYAHLLVGPGTDTTCAAYLDWKENGESPYGCSIHALAHRTVMSFEKEMACHETLYNLGKATGITAHVSDTYNFFDMVDQLCKRIVSDWKSNANVIVLRPDSGDPLECVLHICKTADKYGLLSKSDGIKISNRVRWIQGDSMDWQTMVDIINKCIAEGYSPFGMGAFGIGGFLRNSIARDHTGLSMKLAAVGNSPRPVAKKSETPAKSSIPGEIVISHQMGHSVYPKNSNLVQENALEIWYDGSTKDLATAFKTPCLETSAQIRTRIEDFTYLTMVNSPLCPELIELREQIFKKNVN